MNSKVEQYYPLVLGIIFAVITSYWFAKSDTKIGVKELLSATTTLGGIAIGFLATSISILLTVIKSYILQQIINANAYDKLINYFMDAIQWLFILVLLSTMGLLFNIHDFSQPFRTLAFGSWALVFMTSGLSSYRVIRIFAKILRTVKH